MTTTRPGDAPVVRLSHTPGAVLRNSRAVRGTKIFLSVGTGELRFVRLEGNILDRAKTATEER